MIVPEVHKFYSIVKHVYIIITSSQNLAIFWSMNILTGECIHLVLLF